MNLLLAEATEVITKENKMVDFLSQPLTIGIFFLIIILAVVAYIWSNNDSLQFGSKDKEIKKELAETEMPKVRKF